MPTRAAHAYPRLVPVPEDVPEQFIRALRSLRAVTVRPEIVLDEVPGPARIAPFSAALTAELTAELKKLETKKPPVLGITGTGGAGKSSLVDELVRRFLIDFKDKTLAVISVDPSKRKTGGALLLFGVLAAPALADNPTTKPPCMWAGGLYSPGAALCVGNGQALVCDNGEWHPASDANTSVAALSPLSLAPWAVVKKFGEVASPAKNRRPSTGAARVARSPAWPGSACE